MKRPFVQLASIIALTLLSQNVKADTLVGPGGAFQSWTASVLGPADAPTYGGPYWNNFSGDGPTDNIGWCLVGTGGCGIASPPGAIDYYGKSSGAAVSNMDFVSNGTAVTLSLLAQLTNQLGTTANPGYNVFGWYQIKPDGSIVKMTNLWQSNSDAIGENVTFTPGPAGTKYGLFLENIQGGGLADYFWFMNSTQDTSQGLDKNPFDKTQHFAVFNNVPTPGSPFYVGIDDTNFGNQDYNDMVIELVNAPEPRTGALFGIGLLLCGLLIRRTQAC